MEHPPESERPDPGTMRFEEAVEELEAIIERIEQGEIGLEESLVERRRGEALIRRGRAILDTAEQELERVDASEIPSGGEGGAADDETKAPPGEEP